MAHPKNTKKTNVITVTLDLDALRAYATEIAKANEGSLESSSGMTPQDLDMAWDAMDTFFHGPNDGFRDAVNRAISVLQDVHRSE